MKTVTKSEFQALASDFWGKVFQAAETMTSEEVEKLKKREWAKLKEYRIVLPEAPSHKNEELNRLISAYCDDVSESRFGAKMYRGKAGTAFSNAPIDDCFHSISYRNPSL